MMLDTRTTSLGGEYIFTEDELREKCAEWQEILRLQDWNMVVRVVPASEMSDPKTPPTAECKWSILRRWIVIRIIDPEDYPNMPVEQDMEQSLVHEMLHAHYAFFAVLPKDDETKNIAQEQSVDALATALVNLRRDGLDRR